MRVLISSLATTVFAAQSLACASASLPAPDPTAPDPDPTAPTAAPAIDRGDYRVEGLTVQAAHGQTRPVTGRLRIDIIDDRYETAYVLETTYPTATDEAVPARITGSGKGVVFGGKLAGITASTLELEPEADHGEDDTQVIDLISIAVTEVGPDGALIVRLQNEPGPSHEYTPSVTVLRATPAGEPSPAD